MKTASILCACSPAVVALAFAGGCGGDFSSTSSGGGTGGDTTTTGGTSTGGATTGGAGGTSTGGATTGGAGGTPGTGGTGGVPSDCKGLAEAIAQQVAGTLTCTTVVRLDYQTVKIKGYQILCGNYGAITEDAARATSQADTGFGATGQLLSGLDPADEYVFYESPLDFGGVGVVSALSGQSVFGGGIVWDGMGQISYPALFEPASSLGWGCTPLAAKPSARGWDLRDASALSDFQVSAALDVVWGTALPDGLWQGGYVFDAVVLLYPPAMGAFDPAAAEWIVMVNSGWLE